MNVTLLIPTLNEEEGLLQVLPKIPRERFTQILVVDGQSTDGTQRVARENGLELYVQKARGLRNGYMEAWPLVRGEYVLTFSPDGNCRPEDLAALIDEAAKGYDMVVGSRYLPPAYSEDDDIVTGFGNWMFTNFINLCHQAKYSDAFNIYRIYRTSLFRELGLDQEAAWQDEKYFFTISGVEPLLSIRAVRAGKKISEVPAIEPKRMTGERKLQVVRWGLLYLWQTVRETRWRHSSNK